MPKHAIRITAIFFTAAFVLLSWKPEDFSFEWSDPDAFTRQGTSIRPVLDEPLPAGRNLLWCATFPMAWQSAMQKLGGPLRLNPPTPVADTLNHQTLPEGTVDAASSQIISGTVEDGVLDQIAGSTVKLTGKSKLLGDLKKISQPSDLVFHAALAKDLTFPTPFGKLGTTTHGRKSVGWFGFLPKHENTAKLHEQTAIHHYGGRHDFVIELLSSNKEDQLLVAKLPEAPANGKAIVAKVVAKLAKNPSRSSGADLLAVPLMKIDEATSFPDLEGRTIAGTLRFIRSAKQSIDFDMDEKGARLRSEAALVLGCAAQAPIKPRLIVADPPFAIVMKRRASRTPYFVAWIANADLLTD